MRLLPSFAEPSSFLFVIGSRVGADRVSEVVVVAQAAIDRHDTRFLEARALLELRGIEPKDGHFTARPLARELARRGWRWELGSGKVRVTKAFSPMAAATPTFVAHGEDQAEALAIVLADAIRYDEERGLSLAGPYRPDIVLRAPDGRTLAAVEIRSRENLTGGIAVHFRRDLMADGRLDSRIRFFGVLSQDIGFLWDQPADRSPAAEPTISFPMTPVVAHYAEWLGRGERLTEGELEPIAALWLSDLANGHPARPKETDRFFDGTAFLEYIRGATVGAGAVE